MKLGDILAELREDKSLKQKELAEQLHVSISSISAYETGSRVPNADALVALADYFDVTTDYLLGLTANPISPSIFEEEFVENVTIATVVKELKSLTPEQKDAIMVILKSMRFCNEVSKKAKANGEQQL